MLVHQNSSPLNSNITQYLVAAAIFAFALILRFLVLPVNAGLPYITFYPATIICFYLCSFRVGAIQVIVSAIAGFFIFTEPNWSLSSKTEGFIPLIAYLITSTLIGIIVNLSKKKMRAVTKHYWKTKPT